MVDFVTRCSFPREKNERIMCTHGNIFFVNNLLRYRFELIWYHFVASACVAPPCIRHNKYDINTLVDNSYFLSAEVGKFDALLVKNYICPGFHYPCPLA
jgi:hypothetical protein